MSLVVNARNRKYAPGSLRLIKNTFISYRLINSLFVLNFRNIMSIYIMKFLLIFLNI